MQKIPVRQIKQPDIAGSFNIRDISVLLSGKDMFQELHRHDFFFLLALQKGSGEHIIDFTPYTIGDHSIFFMRPGQVHQLTLKKGSAGFLMEFNNDYYTQRNPAASQALRKVSVRNYFTPAAEGFQRTFRILEDIFLEFSEKKDNHAEIIRAYLDILFIELERQSHDIKNPGDEKNLYAQEKLEEFLDLLRTHLSTSKQVSQYADKLHLSPYQLNAITRETLGKTCSELINEHIILEAKRQLLATKNQINQIAWDLGYEDNSYFIRFFKKHTGYTPEIFRKNFK